MNVIKTGVSIIVGLLIWELLIRVIRPSEFFIVAPSAILMTAIKEWGSGALQVNLLTSAYEIMLGVFLAIITGVFIGYLTGINKIIDLLFEPWVAVLNSVPIILLVPLMIAWFGLGITPKVVIVYLSAVFPVLLNTRVGVKSVNSDYIELAKSMMAGRRAVFSYIYLPGSLPYIVTACKLGIGRGLVGVVTAELFGAVAGLGHMLKAGAERYETAEVFLAVALLGILGVLNFALLGWIEAKLAPWRKAYIV
ncbi:ABC transporter permease [Paradesulfitobacterium aromaticivorans]